MLDYSIYSNHVELLLQEECEHGRGGAHDEVIGAPAAAGRTLSNAHIRPFLEYRANSSLLKSSRGIEGEQVGGGLRGDVKGFSVNSRRRLMHTIGGIRRDADLPLFVTLTYPEKFPSPSESKKHLTIFFKRMARRFSSHGSIWKLEPQERGAPHYHILTWGVELEKLAGFVVQTWFDIAGDGDVKHLYFHLGLLGRGNKPCVQQVNSWRGVWSYASKYLGKTFDVSGWKDKWTGRYWGVVNRRNVPFGDLIQLNVTEKKAVEVMRYGRRFSGQKQKNKHSMNIFCDAEHWVDKLQIGGDAISK